MIRAWHFVGDTLRDGRPIPKDGVWLEHGGQVILCEQGLHASRCPFDALQYAPGATLCLVDLDGKIVRDNDKLAASGRRIIARRDMTDILRYFARMQALSVVNLMAPCPPDVVLDYLMTGDEALRAAAWDAAWDAAWYAARDAAGDAAWAAAWDAAWDAAWYAARDAARDAAWDAARDAAWDAARDDFVALVYTEFGVSN